MFYADDMNFIQTYKRIFQKKTDSVDKSLYA